MSRGLFALIQELRTCLCGSSGIRPVVHFGVPERQRERRQPALPTSQFRGCMEMKVLTMNDLPSTHRIPFLISGFVDANQNPASVDGAPEYLVDNPNVLRVDVDASEPSGLKGWVVAVGPVGSGVVSLRVDADLGEGVKQFTAPLGEFNVIAGEAVGVSVSLGTAEPQPVP